MTFVRDISACLGHLPAAEVGTHFSHSIKLEGWLDMRNGDDDNCYYASR